MEPIIIGVILIAAGFGLFYGHIASARKLREIQIVDTFSVSDLMKEASDVAEGMGETGSFTKMAEVKGVAVSDNPLTSELAQIQCVAYDMTIQRKYEEQYWEKDSNGNQVQRTRTGSDTVASNSQSINFYVQDKSGKIKIIPDSAELIKTKVYSKFEPGEVRNSSISIGSFRLNLGSLNLGGRRTIGYSYEENAIPTGRELYVMGEVVDSNGELQIQKPREKDRKFIVSVKSEEELTRDVKGAIIGFKIGAIAAEIIGIGLIVLKVLNII